jgi:hypothetical protein
VLLDARTMAWTEMRVERDPACPVCAARPTPAGAVSAC